MICVYDIGNEHYERNGDAVLTPLSGRVKMVAGGGYELTMEHPMDPEGKWQHLVPEAIVKVPVPVERIENAFSGYDADVYKTNAEAALRAGPSEPTTITYPAWDIDTDYAVGDKVSWDSRNWQCNYYDETSTWANIAPPSCSWWTEIPRSTSGSAALVTMPAGSELFLIETYDATWFKMSTYYGLQGYIKQSQVTFYEHRSASEMQPRIITEQLFRLKEPTINRDNGTVTVTGTHVSYDLAGVLVQDISIGQAVPALAIGLIISGFMIPYKGVIATDMTDDTNGTYTGEIKGKNGIYALMDPDKGVVHQFAAKLIRDNWDFFIMKKEPARTGIIIRYAKNARGINWKKSSTNLINRIVPIAKDAEGNDLYLPEKWVDSSDIANQPVIYMERLKVDGQVGKDDGSGTDTVWTESNLLDEMRAKAGERFSVDKVDLVKHEVTVQLEQLGDTAEYAWLKDLESVLLYDIVAVTDPEIGLTKELEVTELEWDIIRRKVVGTKLSNIENNDLRSVAGYNVPNNSITGAKLTDDVSRSIIDQVKDIIPEYSDPEASRPSSDISVIDNLTSTSTTDALSAKQGNVLNQKATMTVAVSSISDFNAAANGLVYATNSSMSNAPETGGYWFILTMADDQTSRKYQFAMHATNGNIFVRGWGSSAGWGTWAQL